MIAEDSLTPKSKHDTSTGSWDAETGCWIMPCNAEIWESGSRVQGVFENRGMRYFLGEDDDSDKPVSPWYFNIALYTEFGLSSLSKSGF